MMRNVTLAIDGDDLDRARRFAAEHSTTVNALVRRYIRSLVPETSEDQREAAARMRARSDARTSFMSGRTWTRADLYDRKVMTWR